MRGLIVIFVILAGALAGVGWAQALQPHAVLSGQVAQVIDGDTLRLNTGYVVRLLDINTPELPHAGQSGQPLAGQAKAALSAMVLGKPVQVQLGKRVYDPYDRVLGHVFLNQTDPNRWVNGGMVAAGLAHVYTFPDNRLYGPELLALEEQARAAQRGLWALPRWQVQPATTCCSRQQMGSFVLVQGQVKRVAVVRDRTYLNFGEDWRTDFSVAVDKRDSKAFKQAGIKNFNELVGKSVVVRGVAQPVNGTQIRVTHPEQLRLSQ